MCEGQCKELTTTSSRWSSTHARSIRRLFSARFRPTLHMLLHPMHPVSSVLEFEILEFLLREHGFEILVTDQRARVPCPAWRLLSLRAGGENAAGKHHRTAAERQVRIFRIQLQPQTQIPTTLTTKGGAPQDQTDGFQTSDFPWQPLVLGQSVKVNQRSENHRFGQVALLKSGEVAGATYEHVSTLSRFSSRQVHHKHPPPWR